MTTASLEILIADDDRVPRRLLRRMLESWGHRVIEVENGLQAWQALNVESPPHIAILDWMMPGIDGIELCRRLDQHLDAPLVYTILFTSKRDESDLVHALDNGAHDFQTKPISPGELQARLAVGRRLVEMHDRLQASLSEMERLATTDVLTGIANRRHFYTFANHTFDHARGSAVSTLLLDIDRFKEINDHYGHSAGDSALCQIAMLCQGLLRPTDMVARFGGDEIVILLPNTLLDEACTIAERLRSKIANTALPLKNSDLAQLSVSIGCASTSATSTGTGIDELLGRADAALLKAKSEGRNRVVCAAEPAQSGSQSLEK